jgi:hypothetical protein
MPATPPSTRQEGSPAMSQLTIPIRPRRLRRVLYLTAAGAILALTTTDIAKADPFDTESRAVCTFLSQGHSPLEATAIVATANPDLPLDEVALFVGAAMVSYCPQFIPSSHKGSTETSGGSIGGSYAA